MNKDWRDEIKRIGDKDRNRGVERSNVIGIARSSLVNILYSKLCHV
jgi:hypothetical protein